MAAEPDRTENLGQRGRLFVCLFVFTLSYCLNLLFCFLRQNILIKTKEGRKLLILVCSSRVQISRQGNWDGKSLMEWITLNVCVGGSQ